MRLGTRFPLFTLVLLVELLLGLTLPTLGLAQGLQSNHGMLRAVPAPQAVSIDGKLDEWDLSAEMFSYGVRRLRERYSVKVAAMWDAEALYLGLRWRDPTPLINNVDVDASPGDGWMADSFQGRFIVKGRQVHLTTCYSSKKDKTAAVIEYDAALNQAGRRVFVSAGKVTKDPSGFAQAFVANTDTRGYVQELRIPWGLLGKEFQPTAGGKIGFTGEYFWGNASGTTWPAVMWSDPINPKNPVRVVVYQNPGVWGELELLAQGKLAKPPEVEDTQRLAGTVPLRFEVPADATHFSLVIDDDTGRRVRNLASHQRVEDYRVADTAGKSKPAPQSGAERLVIEVPWDARPDGPWNPDRMLFLGEQLVPAGKYTVRCLVHRGIGVTYAGSFYNPGTPPWPTANGTGAWGFDHTNPRAVAAMPKVAKSKGRVFLGWEHGECGVGFIGLDADGRKIWEWLRRGVGATHIATSHEHVYFTFHSNGHWLARVNPDNGDQIPFADNKLDLRLPEEPAGLAVLASSMDFQSVIPNNQQPSNKKTPPASPPEKSPSAASPCCLAVSLPKKNVVLFLDAASGAVQREVSVEGPTALAALPDGTVVGVRTKGGLFRIAFGAPSAELLHAAGSPLALAADATGQFFVSDRERSNVARFPALPINVTGKLAQIGEQGGHVPGPWNAQRMGLPISIAVEERSDGAARLWVAEQQASPRRISVWDTATGKLVGDYLGNTRYSATGGFLSDDVPGIGFVDGVKFHLDAATGSYTPLEILGGAPAPVALQHNVFTLGKGAGNFANPYHFFSSASGQEREYLVEAGGTQPMVFMKRGDRWQCVAALGSAQQTFPAEVTKAPSPTAVFSWHDDNQDGHQQSAEIRWHDLGVKGVFQCGWGYRCGRDLVFYHSGFAFRPVRFTNDGAPVYDVTKVERLPGELGQVKGDIHKTRFGYIADTSTGEVVDKLNVVHGLHFLTGFNEAGHLKWKYPNYWVAVHGAFTAPMAMPGVLMGVLKTSGVISGLQSEAAGDGQARAKAGGGEKNGGAAGKNVAVKNHGLEPSKVSVKSHGLEAHATGWDVVSLRGNIGQEFLIRDDGLYLGELFTDQRMAPADLPPTRDIVGAPINETTLGGEPFNGWIGRQRDGKVRMTYGYTDVRIAEVVGLDRVTDLPPQIITLGEPELSAARQFRPKQAVARQADADIPNGAAFTDADVAHPEFFADQNNVLVIRSGREELGRARLRWDESGLHLAVQVADATPLVNKGASGPLAFKTGDSVSLFASPMEAAKPQQQGGTRVLFAQLKTKPSTMVYRPVGPGNSPFVFESPVRKSPFAYVAEASELKFAATPGQGSYTLRATIPWATLSVQPAHDLKLRGDLGLLFGDDSGTNTAQRVHWVDRETNVVNDVPTEAEFFPERWGTWTLRGKDFRRKPDSSATTPARPIDRPFRSEQTTLARSLGAPRASTTGIPIALTTLAASASASAPEHLRNPWPADWEREFQARRERVLKGMCAKEKAGGLGNRTYFESEKRAYGFLMAHLLAGDKETALTEIQKEDAQAKQWHAHTAGIDYYACFTLKHQIRKYFLFGDQLSPAYRQRMFDGAKAWTEKDPLRRPHPAFVKPGEGWGPDVKNSWVDVRSTENLFLMRVTSVYLMAEETRNEATRQQYQDILLKYAASLYRVGMGEWDSENYHGHSIAPLLNLYDFAKDPAVKAAAKASLDYVCAIGAVKYYRGAFNGPTNRDYNHAQPFGGSAPCILWLYFGDAAQDNTVYESDEVHVLSSAYRPPQAVVELARKQFQRPAEWFASKPSYSTTTANDWKSPPEYFETQYVGRTFQLGSLVGGTTAGITAVNGFKIVADDQAKGVVAIQGVPGPDPKFVGSAKYTQGKVAGENRIGQHANVALWLVQGGDAPWVWVLPDRIQVETDGGVTFLRCDRTWIALHPINATPPQVDAELTKSLSAEERDAQWKGHRVLAAKGRGDKFCGVAIEVGEAPDFADYAAFKRASLSRAKTNVEQLAQGEVEFLGASGKRVGLQFALKPRETSVTRNTAPHDWAEHAQHLYRSANEQPPIIEQAWLGGTLTVRTAKATFKATVSETGSAEFATQ